MSAIRVAIVDSGGANTASLVNALNRLGVACTRTRDARSITGASHVILPGVGAAADGMQKLAARKLTKVISRLRQPVLGICLGMQLFARFSAEQDTRCLGIVPAEVRKLRLSPGMPVPNIGWCRIHFKKHHELFSGIDDGSYFYFVHGYALATGNFTIATADHSAPFTAVLACRNFYATQFHPERSAQAGATFLENFLGISA